uniref:JunB proto-onco, AP-1 transcription factor subunit n=1 Tax=Anolis carolinensis TaxID=28377 RepID=H9GR35_ANOCA
MCTKMEQPFYPDSFLSGYSQDYKALKASGMALNLSAEPSSSFRGLKAPLAHHPQQLRAQEDFFPAGLPPHAPSEGANAVNSLKLAAPELERLIVQNGSSSGSGVIATTPTPGQYFYPRGATEEQEGFADGFVKALDDLHKMNHLPPPNVSLGAAAAAAVAASSTASGGYPQEPPPIYTNLTSYNPPALSGSPGFPSANLSYLPAAPWALGGHQPVPYSLTFNYKNHEFGNKSIVTTRESNGASHAVIPAT